MIEKIKQGNHTYAAIFSMALLTFVGILNETAMNVTYPELVTVFGVSLDVIQWITTGYLLMAQGYGLDRKSVV